VNITFVLKYLSVNPYCTLNDATHLPACIIDGLKPRRIICKVVMLLLIRSIEKTITVCAMGEMPRSLFGCNGIGLSSNCRAILSDLHQ